MLGDLSWLIVRFFGGFWSFRERMLSQQRGSLRYRVLRAIYYVYLQRYGAFISHSARFGGEPCFPHGIHGIFVAGNARIGRSCVIFHQVTIGANSLPDSKGAGSPVIGDRVYMGAGAKVIGAVSVGNDARIGANCAVSRDVPDNAVVVLQRPDVILRTSKPDNRYFRWSPTGPVFFDDGRWLPEKDPKVVERLREAL